MKNNQSIANRISNRNVLCLLILVTILTLVSCKRKEKVPLINKEDNTNELKTNTITWGACAHKRNSDVDYPAAWRRVSNVLGSLHIARIFDDTINPNNPELLYHKNTGTPVIASFKIKPWNVLPAKGDTVGPNDELLRQYFKILPNYSRYVYWHEPDNEIFSDSLFTSEEYLKASKHIKKNSDVCKSYFKILVSGNGIQFASRFKWRPFYPKTLYSHV